MDQGRRLQGVIRPLAAQIGLRETAQFAVDARNQRPEVVVVGPRQIGQDPGDFGFVGGWRGQNEAPGLELDGTGRV